MIFQKLVAASLLVLALACGGPIDADAEAQDLRAPLSFEPFSSFAAARARAQRYAANCGAVDLSGALTRDRHGYQWNWTFQCDGRRYVRIAVGPGSVRVVSREVRAYFMAMGTFDPAAVRVSAIDLASLLRRQGYALPDSMTLTAPLSQKMEPRWTASLGARTLFVNALTGDIDG